MDDAAWYVYLNEWVRKAAQDYNLPWARRVTSLLVYTGVYEYAVPSDYRNIIAPEKPISEEERDDAWFLFQTQKSFARNQNSRNDLAVSYHRETPFFNIRYDDTALSNIILHDMNDVDADGTWSVSGATGLTEDKNVYRQGSTSIRFNVAAAGTVTLTNSTFTARNLDSDSHTNRSKVFVWLFLPVTGVTSVELRWGSSASAYWSRSVTANHDGSSFDVGWNLLGFEWNGATETGTVDETAITYLRVSLSNAGAGNGYRVDHIVSRMPKEFDLNYYSKHVIKAIDNTYKEFITANDDSILGDTEYEDCSVFYAVRQAARYTIKDADLAALAGADFETAFAALKVRHPNMAPKVQHTYMSDRYLKF